MIRTRVGYCGGDKQQPTYHDLGDHTETVEIDYDPNVVSYAHLLELFWEMHTPTSPPWSQQYKSAVFYHNDEQRKIAEEVKARVEKLRGRSFTTELLPMKQFWLAEDYHQKYYLRQIGPLESAYKRLYPKLGDFINSTAVARVNGYVGGSGDGALLEKEIGDYGLNAGGQTILLDLAKNSRPVKCAY